MSAEEEIRAGERFAFGDNWRRFLEDLTDDQVRAAVASIESVLGRLDGKTFLDVGSGSGLSSLAARRLGASVTSIDFDPTAVECTATLRQRFFPEDAHWNVMAGSALDAPFLSRLGQYDVVYSWGVLHHTGSMWQALANMPPLVRPGGALWVALYNDQGPASRVWAAVKKRYNRAGPLGRRAIESGVGGWWATRRFAVHALRKILRFQPRATGGSKAGMKPQTDLVDWVGGWPFEVSKPDEVFDFFRAQGFALEHLVTVVGHGCNEYVFRAPA